MMAVSVHTSIALKSSFGTIIVHCLQQWFDNIGCRSASRKILTDKAQPIIGSHLLHSLIVQFLIVQTQVDVVTPAIGKRSTASLPCKAAFLTGQFPVCEEYNKSICIMHGCTKSLHYG